MTIQRVQLPSRPAATSAAEADEHGAADEQLIRDALATADRVIVAYPDGSDDLAYLDDGVLVVEGYEDEEVS